MKLKRWVEITLIIITLAMTFRMFMVDEVIGCTYLLIILINLHIISVYGTLIDKLDTKLDTLKRR